MTPPSGTATGDAVLDRVPAVADIEDNIEADDELLATLATADDVSSATSTARTKRPAVGGDRKTGLEQFALGFFVVVPFLGLLAAIPVFWGWGLGWHDIVLSLIHI